MFARILYSDKEKRLEINWAGLGSLQVRFWNGAVRKVHPVHKQVILSIVTHFESLGQRIHPDNPKCTALLGAMCELASESPNSLAWQVMMSSDLREIAAAYASDE